MLSERNQVQEFKYYMKYPEKENTWRQKAD